MNSYCMGASDGSHKRLPLIAVFINPSAGRGRPLRVWEAVEAMLIRDGLRYEAFQNVYPSSLYRFDSIVVIGGDGTVNHLVNHYPELGLPIGIIPGGSGNDLATSLFAGIGLEAQYRNALFGTPRTVDGRCLQRKDITEWCRSGI